jgi:hypothetical protein
MGWVCAGTAIENINNAIRRETIFFISADLGNLLLIGAEDMENILL